MFTHLHVRSWFSFLAGGSSPDDYVARAGALGMHSLALTDVNGVYGAVRFQQVCRKAGIAPIVGAEVPVLGEEEDRPRPIVLLATSRDGYANLCRILTEAHQRSRESPYATCEDLAAHAGDLHGLTGAAGSLLWDRVDDGRMGAARAWVGRLHEIYGDRLSIELTHHALPDDRRRLIRLKRLSDETGIPIVATGDVRFAVPEHYRRYDLVTCIRNGITIFDPHPDRPRNAEAYLKSEAQLRKLIPWPAAFERAEAIAEACRNVDLLPGSITPPPARVEAGTSSRTELRRLSLEGIEERYREDPSLRARAERQLKKELRVIFDLGLEEFFLVVHEIIHAARRKGIRCAGRGSAANSIVAYLLRITDVDPLAHKLLFERFLHGGRKGTPDIDIDFESSRRPEVIRWIEERFGKEMTAMTATLITYRMRSAIRDVAKALGWPMETVNELSKAVSPSRIQDVHDYRVSLEQVVRPSPLLNTLMDMVESLADCPRHLGQHSGGMVLSRLPLSHFTPVQISANGVSIVQFDKYDVEALGLVKLDVLGLRMLSTISESMELIHRHADSRFELEKIRLDDIPTFNMIRASETLGTFQIESQGQLHLLAAHQPETFDDLIAEIALFRPGPLQGNMVHPFVRRSRGEEPVTYDHPDLEPILCDTYGVILYQEQILEIAHRFAGMSLSEADDFRALMSRFQDTDEAEAMRVRFVGGAAGRGVDEEAAHAVFDKVSKYVGFGFCKSHAAAFAKTVYQSCWLKCHYPAAFMASVMQHRPGMYNLMTLEEEARRFGVTTLPPEINRSGTRYDLEPAEELDAPSKGRRSPFHIRKPLTSIKHVTVDTAARVVWERLTGGAFTSVEDVYRRVPLEEDALRSMARSGALDAFAGDSRRALWEVGLLLRSAVPRGRRGKQELFAIRAFTENDIPELPEPDLSTRLSWDYEMHGAGRMHPMTLVRRRLADLEIRTIETCYRIGRYFSTRGTPIMTVAGLSVLRQRPPTAKGVLFVTLEDETGFIQCVVRPEVLEHLDHVLRRSSLIVRGELHIQGNWRGLVVQQAWALDGVFGGYEGHPCQDAGRDRLVLTSSETAEN